MRIQRTTANQLKVILKTLYCNRKSWGRGLKAIHTYIDADNPIQIGNNNPVLKSISVFKNTTQYRCFLRLSSLKLSQGRKHFHEQTVKYIRKHGFNNKTGRVPLLSFSCPLVQGQLQKCSPSETKENKFLPFLFRHLRSVLVADIQRWKPNSK